MSHNSATVLIVDDDADIRNLMKLILEVDGYHVSVAADGLDALQQLETGTRPALILLDLMMPRMDGEQFLKQLSSSRFATIPVVIMSGHSAARKKAEEFKAAGCLMKPVEYDELVKTVRRFAAVYPQNGAA